MYTFECYTWKNRPECEMSTRICSSSHQPCISTPCLSWLGLQDETAAVRPLHKQSDGVSWKKCKMSPSLNNLNEPEDPRWTLYNRRVNISQPPPPLYLALPNQKLELQGFELVRLCKRVKNASAGDHTDFEADSGNGHARLPDHSPHFLRAPEARNRTTNGWRPLGLERNVSERRRGIVESSVCFWGLGSRDFLYIPSRN